MDSTQERIKTKVTITIPLSEQAVELLSELSIRTNGSAYMFPSRRASKRLGYILVDTLNHALAKMFGMKVDSNKIPYLYLLGAAGIEHFFVYDLRRTCRSLLAYNRVPSHIAKRCLNHKVKGVEGIYDRYDYLKERREALSRLTEIIYPLVNFTAKH